MKKLIAVCIPTLLLSACVIHVGHSSAAEDLKHQQRQLQLSAAVGDLAGIWSFGRSCRLCLTTSPQP